uniref:Uncharacterized protein n=1 Tax=Clytia hemisphaerica TaxID=252671 RepID=A0A7M5WTZ7_9CNID
MSFLTTPKKCSGKRSRKQKTVNQSLKRQKTDNVEDEENHLRDCFLSSSSTSGEDENEEENLEEEIDWKKLEQVLEESAQKANLTAVNVKSILHHILRDKRVIDYAQDIADSVPLPETKVTEATKMTRSKAKLFGQQPLLTALETTKPKSILDLEFSDSSSDDEDFQPGHDTEASQTSDDDMTDRLSDITADARSPRVLTTPKPELNNSLQVIDEGQIMVGAVSTPISKDDLIASRTRSRCPMEDVTVEDLEALFNPPDFEPTSFVPEDLDADELIWQGWLVGLTKPEKSVLNDTNDDDKDDEDFNYMEATAEEEIEIEEELRDDRATRITQKELQGLFNELLLGYDQDAMDNYDELIQELCEEQPQSQSNRFEVPCDSMEAADGLVLTYQMRQQMTAQLQQHVQMLSQVYMLSCTHSWLRNETHQCKQYIEELATFHDKAVQNSQDYLGSLSPELSMFCTPGISDSFNIIKSLAGQKIVTRNPKSQMQKAKKNVTISDTIAEMFTTIPFFATYIELVPKQGPQNEEMQRRTRRKKFLQCEDNLLALGLDQFKGKRYERFEAIKEHLLPIFDPKQLQIRVKNCTSTLKLKYNPIAYVKNEKRVPELENEVNITVPRNISEIPLYKLPKMVWKHRFIPNWFLKVDRELGKNEKIILEQKHLKEYEKKNKLFEIAQQHIENDDKCFDKNCSIEIIVTSW